MAECQLHHDMRRALGQLHTRTPEDSCPGTEGRALPLEHTVAHIVGADTAAEEGWVSHSFEAVATVRMEGTDSWPFGQGHRAAGTRLAAQARSADMQMEAEQTVLVQRRPDDTVGWAAGYAAGTPAPQ